MVLVLLGRKARSLSNSIRFQSRYEGWRNAAFSLAGLGLLYGLHDGFFRLLTYLKGVPAIGPLLIWKLTAMMMLTTFSMVVVSSLLTSLTTLYYSFDLKFLFKTPLSLRAIFIDKSLESVFFSSWMIGLVMIPFVGALMRVNHYGAGFFAAFVTLLPAYLALAAALGIAFTLIVMYAFPSARTRDVIYILSTLSLTVVYGSLRFAQPERLIRPDALHVVAEYLNYLQAPTAPMLPSWWLTRALQAAAAGKANVFAGHAGLLFGVSGAVYALLVLVAERLYFRGYSGAQEGARKGLALDFSPLPEGRWTVLWKERKGFFRDVKHWSQIVLVLGLIFVYLFSIRRLPLDQPDLRSLICFLNIGIAGFVLAALGLRFTYPSISLEGRAWWVLGSAPVTVRSVMLQKWVFSAVPMLLLALILGATTNRLLEADPFTAAVSLATLLVMTAVICCMGVGFGALFPMFNVENIHQIESSLGGFVYMAASLVYIGLTVMVESWPMQMHFRERFGAVGTWSWGLAGASLAGLFVVNAAAILIPWSLGERALQRHE
jgi:ABC-2 type transport system permease protein